MWGMCVFLVGYAVDAAKKATGKMYPFFQESQQRCLNSLTVTDRIYASNGSCNFFQVLGIKHLECAKLFFYYWYERTVDILSWLKQNLTDHHGVLKNTIVLEHNTPPGKWISKHYGAKLSGIVGKHAHLPTCRV